MIRKNLKVIVITLSFLSFLAVLTFTMLYFYQFYGGLSTSTEKWGHFGEYFSGTVGVILSFVNFLIILGLHYDSQNENHHRWITQIRIESFHKILSKLDKLTYEHYRELIFINKLQKDLRAINLHRYFHLTPTQEQQADGLLTALISKLYEFEQVLSSYRPATNEEELKLDKPGETFERVLNAKRDLLDYLHNVIMRKA
jgi:hypothetical protein